MGFRPKSKTLVFVGLVAALGVLVGFLRPGTPVVRLASPSSYPKGSELYYLSWIQHGSFGQRGGAARKLLSLPNRHEYETTLSTWQQTKKWDDVLGGNPDLVIQHMLLVALFDLRPSEYHRALADLVRRDPQSAEDIWVKTDDVFEGEYIDFMFDPAKEGAFRLIKRGYADSASIRALWSAAMSFYPADRKRAATLFRLFPGLPAYDPTQQPKTINDLPVKTESQVTAIKQWFDEHQNQLRWSPQKGQYELAPS